MKHALLAGALALAACSQATAPMPPQPTPPPTWMSFDMPSLDIIPMRITADDFDTANVLCKPGTAWALTARVWIKGTARAEYLAECELRESSSTSYYNRTWSTGGGG